MMRIGQAVAQCTMSDSAGEIERPEPARAGESFGFAPYGQLIKMLLPRSSGVAIYDDTGILTWCSDGYEKPEYRELAGMTLSGPVRSEPSGSIRLTSSQQAAYCATLSANGRRVGCLIIELGDTRDVWNETVIIGLLTPVLRCLEGCLMLGRTVADNGPTTAEREALDLLLAVDEQDPAGRPPLHNLLQNAIAHLNCTIGALVISDRNLVVACDASGDVSKASSALLNRTQKNLLAWAQLNNRPMLVNHVGTTPESLTYKILSCPVRDLNDRVTGVIALFRQSNLEDFDLQDVRILEVLARRAVAVLHSRHDPVTGLVNRAIFERSVQRILNVGGDDATRSLLYIDIDRLHSINEAFGYEAGDEVIQRLGEAVQSMLRPIDMASRLGGDRIAVYLQGRTKQEAHEFAESLVQKMQRLTYLKNQTSIQVSISIGAVMMTETPTKLAHALAAAELACKQAKSNGRSRVSMVAEDPQDTAGRKNDLYVSVNLQHALANNEFRIQAQPIQGLSLNAGDVVGHELLLRLREFDGGLTAPDRFLDVAQSYGLAAAIDRWVVATAARQLRDAGTTFTNPANQMTFNASLQSIESADYADFVLEQLFRARLPAQAFRFEFTESAALSNPKAARRFIAALRDAGAQVGLDDFGIGLTSFASLKSLPVHYLKIDGSLIRRVCTDRFADSTVKGIAKAAEVLGIFTVAEHVESRAIAERLLEHEINFGQGFYFGRPRPLDEIF